MKRTTNIPASPARGRPREFDVDRALQAAMNVFWEKGYEGTSLGDLTAAMQISRPSLYAAFGNKESLFQRVVERYTDSQTCHLQAALAQRTARAVAESALRGTVRSLTSRSTPRGCLVVQGALVCSESNRDVQEGLSGLRRSALNLFRKRFKRAVDEGDLPADTNPGALASYLSSVIHGMSVLSVGGATRAELDSVANVALRAWPTSS